MVNQPTMVTWMGWKGKLTPQIATMSAMSAEYTVLVRKRLATRSMLPITRRPSPTT